jgi:hypothetical protein
MQNALIGTDPTFAGPRSAAVHIGGSRAMAAASDRYAARLVFQSAGVLIEYLLCVDSGFRIG